MHPELPNRPGFTGAPHTPATPPNRPAAPRYSNDQDHLLDRLAVVMRYRKIALAVFALTSGAIMVQSYSRVAVYQAQARLLIEDERSTAVPGITSPENMYWQDPEPYYNTQYRILRGRDLTRRVAKRLDLANVPEFNGTAQAPAGPAVIARQIVARAIGVVRPAPAEPKEAPRPDETADEAALVDDFIGRVQVVPVTGSRLVDVYFQSLDPRFAAEAANALVDEYVSQNLEVKLQSTQNMLEWLDNSLNSKISPDFKYLLAPSESGKPLMWDVFTGALVDIDYLNLNIKGPLTCCDWHPKYNLVVFSGFV